MREKEKVAHGRRNENYFVEGLLCDTAAETLLSAVKRCRLCDVATYVNVISSGALEQRQNALSVSLYSKQLLPFEFAW